MLATSADCSLIYYIKDYSKMSAGLKMLDPTKQLQ